MGHRSIGTWLGKLSYTWLIPLALISLAAPWPGGPMPHVVEKLTWLFDGRLHRPIDWFDLVFHSAATLMLLAKIAHDVRARILSRAST